MSFRKTGDAQQVSVHNPETGETLANCAKCGKNTPSKMTKQAYVGGKAPDSVCKHCGASLAA